MHLLTQSALLRALGWSLFNSLWQMSLLWAFYHFFLLVFKQLPARARHGLALLLLATGFLWSAINFITAYLFTATFEAPGLFSSGPAGPSLFSLHGFQTILGYGRRLAGELLPWCSSLYLLIVACLLIHYSRQYIRSRRIVREGLSSLAPDFGTFVATTARRMGIRVHVDAYLSSLVQVPVTLGFLKPVILLPVALVTQLTTAQVEAILVHELAHIRRKDYLLNLLITVMELLYFFNPFTRLLIAQLKKEREHCCDDAVLEFRYDPHGYVSALLSLARQQQQATQLAVAAIGVGGEQLLLQRARKILQQKRTDDRPGPRALIGLLLTAVVSVLLLGHARPVRTDRLPNRLLVLQPMATPGSRPIAGLGQQRSAPAGARTTAARRHPGTLPHAKHVSRDLLNTILAERFQAGNTASKSTPPNPAFARLIETASRDTALRDFSMDRANGTLDASQPDPDATADNMPFVPQSSFSFQYTDTLPPGAKLVMMQELSQKALLLQITQVEEELKHQLLVLRSQEAAVRRVLADESHSGLRNTLDNKALKELLQQQLKVQRKYMLNLDQLQRQFQKTSRHLTIVYI
jgi:Zn-dependent protease with chaperone function